MAPRHQSGQRKSGRREVQGDLRGLRGPWATRKSASKYDVLGPDWQQAARQAEQQRQYRTRYNEGDAEHFDFGGAGAEQRLLGFLRHVLLGHRAARVDAAGPAAAAVSRSAAKISRRRSNSRCETSTKAARKTSRCKSKTSVPSAKERELPTAASARNATAPGASSRARNSKSRFRKASATASAFAWAAKAVRAPAAVRTAISISSSSCSTTRRTSARATTSTWIYR